MLQRKQKTLYLQRSLRVTGENGNVFKLVLRRHEELLLDFSVILTFVDRDGEEYRLTRFNGRHSEHTNKLEKAQGEPEHSFRDAFHVHLATERYQLAGLEIDGYATITNLYGSYDQALEEFLSAYAFVAPSKDIPGQQSLGI